MTQFLLTRRLYDQLLSLWRLFPIVLPIQLALDYYPLGRTAIPSSPFTLPGRPTWMFMEAFAPATLLYTFKTVSAYTNSPIPGTHYLLIGLFLVHYLHRAVISPLRNPSMGESHLLIAAMGVGFNICNGMALGGWLGGYGRANSGQGEIIAGCALWAVGLFGNIWHEERLRDIRRGKITGEKKKNDDGTEEEKGVVKVGGREYRIPRGGGFELCWYPHYLSEWLEWTGFMLVGGGGPNFVPAALFVINEIATMLPRALQGRRWYEEMFGEEARNPRRKEAVVPGWV